MVCILLRGTDPKGTLEVAQRIVDTVRLRLDGGGQELLVTPSLGVALTVPAIAAEADNLMRQADTAMYRARQTGKSRYEVYQVNESPAWACSARRVVAHGSLRDRGPEGGSGGRCKWLLPLAASTR